MGAAPVGESLILEFLKKAPAAEFREVANVFLKIVWTGWEGLGHDWVVRHWDFHNRGYRHRVLWENSPKLTNEGVSIKVLLRWMKPSSIQWIFHRWLTLTVASLCLRERGGRFASKDRRSAANDQRSSSWYYRFWTLWRLLVVQVMLGYRGREEETKHTIQDQWSPSLDIKHHIAIFIWITLFTRYYKMVWLI